MTAAATAANPHKGIEEGESFVTCLHGKVDAVFIASGVYTVSLALIIDLLENVFGPSKPTLGLNHNESGRVFGSLKQVVGTKVGSLVLRHDLSVLATGLFKKLGSHSKIYTV